MMGLQLFVKGATQEGLGLWLERWAGWPLIGLVVLAWLGLLAMLVFLLTRVDYRVGRKHLKVVVLGIPVRRVRFDNIRNIHTRRPRFAERWHNMLFPTIDRLLVIEKRRGLFKRLVITPEQRFVFRAELDRAIRAYVGLQPGARPGHSPAPAEPPETPTPTS